MHKRREKFLEHGNFVGINNGNISDCYSVIKSKSAFAGINNGDMTCFYSQNDDIKAFDFDKNIWQKTKSGKRPLRFIPEKWHFANEETEEKIKEIYNKEQLLNFASKVNMGDVKAAKAYVQLKANINLKGCKWVPIGENKNYPFKGVFDGNGFEVINVKGKPLFGNNNGTICNLIVDSKIYDGNSGFVDVNNGSIDCCGAVTNLASKENKIVGGFVGENNGDISKCYAAGSIRAFFIPIWAKILPLLLLFILSSISISSVPYQQFPYDKNQVKYANANQTNENFTSFEFNMVATIDAKAGTCEIDYVNTGDSQKDVVVEVQMTDSAAYAAAGAIDKSPSELQTLMDNGDYDPSNSWTTIARSGAIKPGNKLAQLSIIPLYGGNTLPPGQYVGRAHLIYYNTQTHNREVVENSFALVITVQ